MSDVVSNLSTEYWLEVQLKDGSWDFCGNYPNRDKVFDNIDNLTAINQTGKWRCIEVMMIKRVVERYERIEKRLPLSVESDDTSFIKKPTEPKP